MKRIRFGRSTVLVVLAAVCLLIAYCGGSGGGLGTPDPTQLSSVHTATYVGAGSAWVWDLKADGTAHVEHRPTINAAADLTIEAAYETLSTGFYKFTVTSASGTNPPSAGDKAYGLAIPGVILMVKPIGGNSNIMMMPAVGTCPTQTFDVNWVQVETADQSVTNLTLEPFWGTASVPTTGDITGKNFALDGIPGATQTFTTVQSCADGIMSITDATHGSSGFVTMTSAGVGLVETQDSDHSNAIIAVPKDTSVTTSSLNGKNFVGLVFDEENSTDQVKALNVSFDASGKGTYTLLDPETGATSESGTVTATQAGTGDLTGFLKLDAGQNSHLEETEMWGAVVTDIGNSGRAFMFATGMGVVDGSTPPNATHSFSMVVVEK